jgi:hypothetical protein
MAITLKRKPGRYGGSNKLEGLPVRVEHRYTRRHGSNGDSDLLYVGRAVLGLHRHYNWFGDGEDYSALELTLYPLRRGKIGGLSGNPSLKLGRFEVGCRMRLAPGMIELVPWRERRRWRD